MYMNEGMNDLTKRGI